MEQGRPFPSIEFYLQGGSVRYADVSFSSDKSILLNWMTTPTTYYMNVYSSIIGNPDLKPQLSYSMQLNYV